jgi:hypothetical protein
MSEYQYYEFLAIDRPLTKKEMDAVGQFSSRADISPTRFVNQYHWGNFRGNCERFLREWYDAMLYLANWGTHRFMCRVPLELIDAQYAEACCAGDSATMRIVNGNAALLDFTSDTEGGGGWVEDDEGAGYMASIVPIRAELIAGDQRPLYVAWLVCAQSGELDDAALEPAVPPGLKTLSAAQRALADFLRLDEDLLATAAGVSLPRASAPEGFEDWLLGLPAAEKNELLLSLVNGTDPHAGNKLRRRFAIEKQAELSLEPKETRNVAQLLAAAEAVGADREAHERELDLRARVKREAAERAARAAYLNDLSRREEQAWGKVDVLIATKQPKSYDESVTLLRDLRDLAGLRGSTSRFTANLQRIMGQHIKKPSLIERIKKAGLLP